MSELELAKAYRKRLITRRIVVTTSCFVIIALALGAIVIYGNRGTVSSESRALKVAIKRFEVKPLNLSKVAMTPRTQHTASISYGGSLGAGSLPSSAISSTASPSPSNSSNLTNQANGTSSSSSSTSNSGSPVVASPPASSMPSGFIPIPGLGGSNGLPGGLSSPGAGSPSLGATIKTAPPTFSNQLVSLYQQMYTVNQQASAGLSIPSSGAQAESVSSFSQAVQNTPQQNLNVLYTAVVDTPSFNSVQSLYVKLGSGLSNLHLDPSSSAPSSLRSNIVPGISAHLTPSVTSGSSTFQSPYPYPNSSTTTTFTPAVTATTNPNMNASNCPAGAPGGDYGEDSIYAAQVAIDVFTQVDAAIPQQLTVGAEVLGEGSTVTIPDPAWVVVQALLGAAQITHDTLAYRQAVANDCNNADQMAEVTDIYNNVAYLTALVDSRTTAIENESEAIYALVDSQTSQILNQLSALQSSINLQIEVIIEQDLLQGSAGSVVEVQLPASLGGYLNAVPIGVQTIVINALSQMQQAQQPINPAVPQELAAANSALASGQYRKAYGLYSTAYQGIVQ